MSASLRNTLALVMRGKVVPLREQQSPEDLSLGLLLSLGFCIEQEAAASKSKEERFSLYCYILKVFWAQTDCWRLHTLFSNTKAKRTTQFFPNASPWPMSGDICCRKVPAAERSITQAFVLKLILDSKWADFLAHLYLRVGVMSWSFVDRRRAHQ